MKISLITATFNCVSTLATCLESVASQSYGNIEHIVIDGASTDGTLSLINQYRSNIAVFESGPDQGIYDALNKGVTLASGDVIGILHADDFYVSEHVIAHVAKIFSDNPEVSIVIGNVEYVAREDNARVVRLYASHRFKLWMLRFGFMPAHTASFVRREVYNSVGLYKFTYASAGDFEFFVRALWLHRVPYLIVNQVFIRMRMGGMSTLGFTSYWRSTIEVLSGLRANKVYSNTLFVLARLPVKKISQLAFLARQKLFT